MKRASCTRRKGIDVSNGDGAFIRLGTEQSNPCTAHIDEMETLEALEVINDLDHEIVPAVRGVLPDVAQLVDAAFKRMQRGGRLIYMGAGTSGRLGVLDASECPPTYGVSPDLVIGLIAGGYDALVRSQEGAEDNAEAGAADLDALNICELDTVIGLSASGRTPYVIGGLDRARERGALTGAISCVCGARMSAHADIPIECVVGPEPIMGSTRMRSGTAQKLICNMISTELMVKSGKVFGNLMVDLKPTNEKLVNRASRIIATVSGVGMDEAAGLLADSGYDVKLAICRAISGASENVCRAELSKADGNVARTIRSLMA